MRLDSPCNALVEPHAAAVMGRFMAAQGAFADLPEAEQLEHVDRESADCVLWLVARDVLAVYPDVSAAPGLTR